MVETQAIKAMREQAFTNKQRDFIIGSLLGDAYLMESSVGFALRFHHGNLQESYIKWKYEIMKDFVRTPPKNNGKWYFRTISHPELSKLRKDFYIEGIKNPPIKLLMKELTNFGLAVWFMDDGSRDGRQARINTQSFTKDENVLLQEFLSAKFGLRTTLNKDKEYYRLRIAAASMDNFTSLIKPYIIPSMLYKLSP